MINESLSIKTVLVSQVLMLSQKIKNKAHIKSVIVEKAYFAKSKPVKTVFVKVM